MIGVGTYKVTDKARKYVNDVLSSERLSYGPFTQKFERSFAAAHQSRFAVMTNSGTCCLMIALAALKNRHGWQDGDEVIVPAVTFIATSNIVLQLNMKPVFVDVESTYYELDPSKIEAAITPRTRCIIPVHLFGCPCEMDKIMDIARKHNLRVIEDSCESMFVKYKGTSVGAFGDIGCFSTYVAHILTTGVGGLCTTSDTDLAVNLRSLMNHGRDSIYLNIDDDKNKTKEELEMIIQRRFSFVQMGYSFRATELEGALGLAEFEIHEDMMSKRWQNGMYFIEKLKKWDKYIQLPTVRPEAGHSFMMFPIVLRDESKAKFVNFLEEHGIETRDMLPLINQPYYKKIFNINEDDYPVAKWVNNNGFYIASHQGLTETEKEYIVSVFGAYFSERSIQKNKAALVVMSKGNRAAAELLVDTLPLTVFEDKILVEGANDAEIIRLFQKRGFRSVHREAGKGDLLREAVQSTNCENIVVMGADGSDDPSDINKILIHLNAGQDLVIASRFMAGGGRQTNRPFTYRSVGNRFFSFLLGILFTKNITDTNNLFRGFKRKAFEKMAVKQRGESVMFEMTLRALGAGMKIYEAPTIERPSMGESHKRNRILSGISFLWILFTNPFHRNS